MGAIHALDEKMEWRDGVPWISTARGWVRGKAAWRYNGSAWEMFWQLATEPPRAPVMKLTQKGKGVDVSMSLQGPYPSKIIRAVVKVGINKKPTADSPLGNDGTYYSVKDVNGKTWSEFWEQRQGDIMGDLTTRTGIKPFPQAGIQDIPDGATVYAYGWIQDEYKQWSQVGTASITMPKAPPPPTPNTKPTTPKPTKKTYTDTFSSSWFGSYKGDGTAYAWGNDAGRAMQGQYLLANGKTRSLIGFKDVRGQIGEVKSIEFYVYMEHWYYYAGGTLVVGLHGHKSKPAKWQAGINGAINASFTARGQGKWLVLPAKYLERFHTGAMRGISLFANSTSPAYYGYATASKTRMRITHVK